MDIFFERDGEFVYPKCQEDYCGTACCIAGYAIKLAFPKGLPIEHLNLCDTAAEILRISEKEAERLFYIDKWPTQFLDKYIDYETRRIGTVERIEHFIKTGE